MIGGGKIPGGTYPSMIDSVWRNKYIYTIHTHTFDVIFRSLQQQSLSYGIPDDRNDLLSLSYSYSMSYSYTPSPMPSKMSLSTPSPSVSPTMAPTEEDATLISQLFQRFPRVSNFVETCATPYLEESEYTFQIALHLLITANNQNSTGIGEGFWQFVFPLLADMILECRSDSGSGIMAMDVQNVTWVEDVLEGNLVFFSQQAMSNVMMRMIRSMVQRMLQTILQNDMVELSWAPISMDDVESDTTLVVSETSAGEDLSSGLTGAKESKESSSSSSNKAITWIGCLVGVMGCVLLVTAWRMKKSPPSDMDTSSDDSIMAEL